MGLKLRIYNGEHTTPILVRPDLEDDAETIGTAWECKVGVYDLNYNLVITPESITAKTTDDLHFVVFLVPDKTLALAVQASDLITKEKETEYSMVIETSNASEMLKRERRIPLFVSRKAMHY
ncbi:MAG: hypothetical protein HRT38_02670 [Alteromonadaceae bacterium]|nr:hypothetical protein [Alteromonadaceae bacterium]